jgi:hypothetical protein
MTEVVTRLLIDAGWQVRPEVSFNHFGERGVVDIVAWNAQYRATLLVELKTELADVNDLLAVTDRRRRLAAVIAEPFEWRPEIVGQWVVVAASRTNERRVADHRAVIRSAFPTDGRSIAGWLARPDRGASALWFLPDSPGVGRRRRSGPTQRVRAPRSNVLPRTEAA